MKFDKKDYVRAVIMGVGVMLLTPFLAGFVAGLDFMKFELWPGVLTLGTALAAGVSAFALDLVLDKVVKKN